MAKLSIEVVTGERVVYTDSDVDMVVAPGSDGTLGILPQHAPLITTLAAGELRIKKGGGEQSLIVFGGFMEVTPNRVVVLADTAERTEEINLARAEASRSRAEAAIANRGQLERLEDAEQALRRASLRLQVGQRRRTGGARPPGLGGGGPRSDSV